MTMPDSPDSPRSTQVGGIRIHAIEAGHQWLDGGAMFGVGWAVGGFCPGPALAAWTTNGDLVWFVPAMLISMWISSRIRG